MPAPSTFPITNVCLTLTSGDTVELGPQLTSQAMQYSATEGLPQLRHWCEKLQEVEHGWNVKARSGAVCLTTGSQSALNLALEALLDESNAIVVDEYAYAGVLELIRPMGAQVLGVPMDGDGMQPEALERTLTEAARRGGPRPRFLYTVPTGHNPCGCTMPTRRRREIYQICRKHDILLLEDDPYWFLNLGGAVGEFVGDTAQTAESRLGSAALESFLSMDVDDRVLRFDSLSKVLSSGVRLGWMSGPKEIVERVALHQQVATLHTSGIAQAVVLALLDRWGEVGWRRHVTEVCAFYRARRDAMDASAQVHLTSLASWSLPSHGMFFWFDLLPAGCDDAQRLVATRARDAGVLLVPGSSFAAHSDARSSFVRAAFSIAEPADIDEGLARLAALLRASSASR